MADQPGVGIDVYKRQAPEKANEIATTDLALKALGVEPEIGAEVPLEFELRGKTYHYDMVPVSYTHLFTASMTCTS